MSKLIRVNAKTAAYYAHTRQAPCFPQLFFFVHFRLFSLFFFIIYKMKSWIKIKHKPLKKRQLLIHPIHKFQSNVYITQGTGILLPLSPASSQIKRTRLQCLTHPIPLQRGEKRSEKSRNSKIAHRRPVYHFYIHLYCRIVSRCWIIIFLKTKERLDLSPSFDP